MLWVECCQQMAKSFQYESLGRLTTSKRGLRRRRRALHVVRRRLLKQLRRRLRCSRCGCEGGGRHPVRRRFCTIDMQIRSMSNSYIAISISRAVPVRVESFLSIDTDTSRFLANGCRVYAHPCKFHT